MDDIRGPGTDAVAVRSDVEFATTDAGPLTLDLYTPAGARPGDRREAVVFVTGFPDPAMQAHLGRKLKDTAPYTSGACLVAASGLVGVTDANGEPEDVFALLGYLRTPAAGSRVRRR